MLWHKKAQCWFKPKETNMAKQVEVTNFFMVKNDANVGQGSVWIVDSGCSNHMTGECGLFHDLVETQGQTLRLGDNLELEIIGKGSVLLIT